VGRVFAVILHGNIAFGVKAVKKNIFRSQAMLISLLE
jgi:hypothetical protein